LSELKDESKDHSKAGGNSGNGSGNGSGNDLETEFTPNNKLSDASFDINDYLLSHAHVKITF
jgi:hypothetical protein